jgi:hypothetical protein
LVSYFHEKLHRAPPPTLTPKALDQATVLLARYGEDRARAIVDFACTAARATRYAIHTFGGILPYAPSAVAAYDLQQQRAAQQQAARQQAQVCAQYEDYWRARVAQVKATLPAGDLAALTARIRAELQATGAIACEALGLATKVRVDEALAQQAGVLSFAAWREQHGQPCGRT